MPYTEEQLLHHIRNGRSLGQLVTMAGLDPTWLEEFAQQHGYVFGSNGVPRRSAVPLISSDGRDEREPDWCEDPDCDGLGCHKVHLVDHSARELVARDVLDDQADLALDAALDAIEALDWPHLIQESHLARADRLVARLRDLTHRIERLSGRVADELAAR